MTIKMARVRTTDTARFDHDRALSLREQGMPTEIIASTLKTTRHQVQKLFDEIDTFGGRRQASPLHWRKAGYDWHAARSMAAMAQRFACRSWSAL